MHICYIYIFDPDKGFFFERKKYFLKNFINNIKIKDYQELMEDDVILLEVSVASIKDTK